VLCASNYEIKQKKLHSQGKFQQPAVFACLFGQVVSSRLVEQSSEFTGKKSILIVGTPNRVQPIYSIVDLPVAVAEMLELALFLDWFHAGLGI
jgi:hypothetical protein